MSTTFPFITLKQLFCNFARFSMTPLKFRHFPEFFSLSGKPDQLTHLFLMNPFSTPFQGVEKRCIASKWVKQSQPKSKLSAPNILQ